MSTNSYSSVESPSKKTSEFFVPDELRAGPPPIQSPPQYLNQRSAEPIDESQSHFERRTKIKLPNWLRELIPSLASLVAHLVVLVLLAILVSNPLGFRRGELLDLGWSDSGDSTDLVEISSFESAGGAPREVTIETTSELVTNIEVTPDIEISLDTPPIISEFGLSSEIAALAQSTNVALDVNALTGIGFGERSGDGHSDAVSKRGGNAASEQAVDAALEWFARHQLADGSWSSQLKEPPCKGRCSHGSTTIEPFRHGSTGLALLCFLGRGYTHKSGPYQETVRRGLRFLQSKTHLDGLPWDESKKGIRFASLSTGAAMYEHGLATLALTEAYQLTQDESLVLDCRNAIKFINFAQHSDGSWGYDPKTPGDLSIACWQIMAIKSAATAKFDVSSYVIKAFEKYLDTSSRNEKRDYAYRANPPSLSMTAIGHLMRMYLGTSLTSPELLYAIALLDRTGPSKTDVYYNYYASQVMYHYGQDEWQRWNVRMRDYLINTQANSGHESGSWFFEDESNSHNETGGRLYCTAMATLTLEVYYRFLPIYQNERIDDFQL